MSERSSRASRAKRKSRAARKSRKNTGKKSSQEFDGLAKVEEGGVKKTKEAFPPGQSMRKSAMSKAKRRQSKLANASKTLAMRANAVEMMQVPKEPSPTSSPDSKPRPRKPKRVTVSIDDDDESTGPSTPDSKTNLASNDGGGTITKFAVQRTKTSKLRRSKYAHMTVDLRLFIAAMLVRDAHTRRPVGDYNLNPTKMKYRILYDHWISVLLRNLALLAMLALLGLEPIYVCEVLPLDHEYPGTPVSCVPKEYGSIEAGSNSAPFFMEIIALSIITISTIFLIWEKGNAVFKDKTVMTVTGFLFMYLVILGLPFQYPIFSKTSWHLRGLLRVTFFLQKEKVLDVLQDMWRTIVLLLPTLTLYMTCVFLFGFYGNILYGHLPNMDESFGNMWSAFKSSFIFATTANFPDIFLPSYGAAWSNSLFFVFGEVLFVYLFFNVILVNVYDAFKGSMAQKRAAGIINRRNALQRAFEILDDDQSGSIHRDEFVQGMRFIFPKLNTEQLQVIFEDMDRDGDDEINIGEFSNICYYLDIRVEKRHSEAIRRRLAAEQCTCCHSLAYEIATGVACVITALVYFILLSTTDPVLYNENIKTLWLFESLFCGALFFELLIRFATKPNVDFHEIFKALPFKDKLDILIFTVCFFVLLISWNDGDHLTGVKRCLCYRLLRIPRLLLRINKKSEEIVQFTAQVIPTLGAPLLTLCMWLYLGVVMSMFFFGGEITLEKSELLDPFLDIVNIGDAQSGPIYAVDRLPYLIHFNDANHALVSLFILMVGNDWQDIMVAVTTVAGEGWVVFFLVFFLVTAVIILNIIIALFIDSYFMVTRKNELNVEEERQNEIRSRRAGVRSGYVMIRNLQLTYDELVHGVGQNTAEGAQSQVVDVGGEDAGASAPKGSMIDRTLSRQHAIRMREANKARQKAMDDQQTLLEGKEEKMQKQELEMKRANLALTKLQKQMMLAKKVTANKLQAIKQREEAHAKDLKEAEAFANAKGEERTKLEQDQRQKFIVIQRKIASIEARERTADERITELDQEEEKLRSVFEAKELDLLNKLEEEKIAFEHKLAHDMQKAYEEKEMQVTVARDALAMAEIELGTKEAVLERKVREFEDNAIMMQGGAETKRAPPPPAPPMSDGDELGPADEAGDQVGELITTGGLADRMPERMETVDMFSAGDAMLDSHAALEEERAIINDEINAVEESRMSIALPNQIAMDGFGDELNSSSNSAKMDMFLLDDHVSERKEPLAQHTPLPNNLDIVIHQPEGDNDDDNEDVTMVLDDYMKVMDPAVEHAADHFLNAVPGDAPMSVHDDVIDIIEKDDSGDDEMTLL